MKVILISLIKFYRKHISPHTSAKCKFYPTCSSYALTAIERFGAVRGSALAVWRIMRCNPWSMGGIDYVPEKFTFKVNRFDYSILHDDEQGSAEFENRQNEER